MSELLIYEIYLSVALKFIKEGKLKKAQECLKIMKKVIKKYKRRK